MRLKVILGGRRKGNDHEVGAGKSEPGDAELPPFTPPGHEARARRGELVRVCFELDARAWHCSRSETLWAARAGEGLYRLKNIPFFVYGVSAEDVVCAHPVDGILTFSRIVLRGGHSTFRIFLARGVDRERFGSHWDAFEALGCWCERGTERLLAIDVPPEASIEAARELLRRGRASGAWTYEEGHSGHSR